MVRKSIIHFYSRGKYLPLKNRTRLKRFISQALSREANKQGVINYVFCDDKEILELNKRFLKHNYYTDILTFDLSQSSSEMIAEIYISLDRVRENAKNFKYSFKIELHRVIFHGILHLCGYSDKSKIDVTNMRMAEDRFIKEYFENPFHMKRK